MSALFWQYILWLLFLLLTPLWVFVCPFCRMSGEILDGVSISPQNNAYILPKNNILFITVRCSESCSTDDLIGHIPKFSAIKIEKNYIHFSIDIPYYMLICCVGWFVHTLAAAKMIALQQIHTDVLVENNVEWNSHQLCKYINSFDAANGHQQL